MNVLYILCYSNKYSLYLFFIYAVIHAVVLGHIIKKCNKVTSDKKKLYHKNIKYKFHPFHFVIALLGCMAGFPYSMFVINYFVNLR